MQLSSILPSDLKLNCPEELIINNVEYSIALGLAQIKPYQEQETKVLIVAGGPSLKDYIEEIKEKREDGYKLVTVNGTHNLMLEHGLTPSAHIQLDAREENAEFVKTPHKDCKYLIASQSHPKVFSNLEGYEVYLWHAMSTKDEKQILDDYYMGNYYPIPGGSTVILRAFQLLRLLGYKWFEVYGWDSCLLENESHAYEQKINQSDQVMTIRVNGKEFQVTPAHFSQVLEFQDMVKSIGNVYNMIIHGDGIMAHLIKSLAKRAA